MCTLVLIPPPILLNREVTDNAKECEMNKIKMRQDPESVMSETYDLKIDTFENGKPEELLALTKNFKTAIDRPGTKFETGRNSYVCTMLHGNLYENLTIWIVK